MEKKDKELIYESDSVLGKLYREIKRIVKERKLKQEEVESRQYATVEEDFVLLPEDEAQLRQLIEREFDVFVDYQRDLDNILRYFGLQSEFEVYSGNFTQYVREERKQRIDQEINQRRVLDSVVYLKKRFEQRFFEQLEEDHETYKANGAHFSVAARQKACTWFLLSYLTAPYEGKKPEIARFAQIYQELRASKDYRPQKTHIGMAWFVIPEVLLAAKSQESLEISPLKPAEDSELGQEASQHADEDYI